MNPTIEWLMVHHDDPRDPYGERRVARELQAACCRRFTLVDSVQMETMRLPLPCVLVAVDLQMAGRRLEADGAWRGCWLSDPHAHRISRLLAMWSSENGDDFVNGDCIWLTQQQVERRFNSLLHKAPGRRPSIFIRPDANNKLFSGRVFRTLAQFRYQSSWAPRDEMLVVAKPKRLLGEYRFVVGGFEVLAGSAYRRRGDVVYSRHGIPRAVRELAEYTAGRRDWQPGWVYTLDIALGEDGRPRIMETGQFETSGFYDCNMRRVAKGVEAIVRKRLEHDAFEPFTSLMRMVIDGDRCQRLAPFPIRKPRQQPPA